jgi:uncharacterized membrane protein YgaE (UPF0421/DUF939 family)
MKLTNYMRDGFVDKVIGSLTKIDYISQTQELLNKDAFNNLPKILQDKNITHYLENKRIYFEGARCMGGYFVRNREYEASDEIKAKVKELHVLFESQREKLSQSEQQLKAMIYGVTTLKAAKEVLPESLHQFLPVESEKKTNSFALVTTELMDNLKAMGLK